MERGLTGVRSFRPVGMPVRTSSKGLLAERRFCEKKSLFSCSGPFHVGGSPSFTDGCTKFTCTSPYEVYRISAQKYYGPKSPLTQSREFVYLQGVKKLDRSTTQLAKMVTDPQIDELTTDVFKTFKKKCPKQPTYTQLDKQTITSCCTGSQRQIYTIFSRVPYVQLQMPEEQH